MTDIFALTVFVNTYYVHDEFFFCFILLHNNAPTYVSNANTTPRNGMM